MTFAEHVAIHGGAEQAARAIGMPATTFRRRLWQEKSAQAVAPSLPSPHLPINALLEQAATRFEVTKTYGDAQQWPVVEIKDKKPIGVLWFGDPHLGDNGCNIPLLRRHAELCASTPGLYGANIGDTTNNWLQAGKLAKLWGEQDASLATERRLAEWFMTESGVNWIVWLVGNHDAWNSGEAILKGMNTAGIFMQNWEAKFAFQFPSGEQVKVHAAHNFKGFSDWNPMHGPLKASIKLSDADLYVAGHIHTPGSMQIDLPGSKRFPLLLRVASYKRYDLHAKLHGFADHELGSAVLTIFNPDAADPSGKITHFFDVELGARVLTMMRAKHEPKQRRQTRRRKKPSRATTAGRSRSRRPRPSIRSGKVRSEKLGTRHGMVPRDRRAKAASKRIRGRK